MVNNILNIKVAREIKKNLKTYISVILIAALAVTLFTGIFANYKNFDDRLEHIYQEANMCDGIVMTKEYNAELASFLDERNIFYEKRIYFSTKSQDSNIYIATFTEDSTLNLPYETSMNTKITSDMVFVDQNFLSRKGLEVGDTFEVSLPMSITLELKISGTMVHPESLENSAFNPAFIYVGYDALRKAIIEEVGFESLVDQILSKYHNQFLINGNEEIFTEIKSIFADEENFIYALRRSDLPSNMTVDADVLQAKQLIYIFPVIFYLVAILIILTSISQLINRESKNIGILKALGYSKTEILFHYMKIFIVLSIIGSILGIILGPIIVPKVMGNKYNILYQLPKINLPFFRIEYLISVAILILITSLTSIFACYEAMNQVPAKSLRGDNSVPLKLSFLNKLKVVRKMPLAVLMAFRNMKRKISRTLMVIIGVLGCSALLLCGFGIEDTLNYGIDLELKELIPYDLTLTYDDNASKKKEILEINHVTEVDEYAKYSITLEKDHLISSYLFLLPETSTIFKTEYSLNSCIISARAAEEIGAKVGDLISFVYQEKRYDITITDIVDFCISQGIFISQNALDIAFAPTGAWVKSEDSRYNNEINDKLAFMKGIQSSLTIEQMRNRADDTISSIKVMTWTVKIFAILLAVVVLYNLALLNFKERIKDIATLKVLGFSKFEVASSFIIEILVLTFVGAIIGLGFGYPLLVAVLSINENPIISYIYHINPISYVITVLITCGSSLVINLIFAFLTNRVPMVESLKSVE